MDAEFPNEWFSEEVATTFFKCTRWLVDENSDLNSCRYHYFCDSAYPGNYSPLVDLCVLFFAVASYLSVSAFSLLALTRNAVNIGTSKKRYLLPSSPISLPLVLLILARGSRVNTLFPLAAVGPALLQLVQISALAFEYDSTDRSVKYAVLDASTTSGILHASLYLDTIIMPYYTGLDALLSSTFSGDCASCVCRNEALVVGGRLVSYRGWSKTTIAVAVALCLRMLARIFGDEKVGLVSKVKTLSEGLSWILIARDAAYLLIAVPQENCILNEVIYGGICVLIFLNMLRKVQGLFAWIGKSLKSQKAGFNQNIVEIP